MGEKDMRHLLGTRPKHRKSLGLSKNIVKHNKMYDIFVGSYLGQSSFLVVVVCLNGHD